MLHKKGIVHRCVPSTSHRRHASTSACQQIQRMHVCCANALVVKWLLEVEFAFESYLQTPYHELPVCRDIKPENLLMSDRVPDLTASPPVYSEVKLCDFGLAKLCASRSDYMRTVCGTWAYSAPVRILLPCQSDRIVSLLRCCSNQLCFCLVAGGANQ
jgi:hypothetical protein